MKQLAACILLLVLVTSTHAESYFYTGSSALALKNDDGIKFLYHNRLGTDVLTKSLPFGQTITSEERFGFTGKEQDPSGLHYFGARYLDTSIGRFTSIDPVPSQPSYQYVSNNPLNSVDPDGRAENVVAGGSYTNTNIARTSESGKTTFTGLHNNLFFLPSAIEKSGLSNIEELSITTNRVDREEFSSRPSKINSLGTKIHSDEQYTLYILSAKAFGEALQPFLSSNAHISFRGMKEQFIEELRQTLPGVTIDNYPSNYNYIITDNVRSTFTPFNNKGALYSATDITSIEKWNEHMANGGLIFIPQNRYSGENIIYSNEQIIHYYTNLPSGKRIINSNQAQYHEFMRNDFREFVLSLGPVKGLEPNNNFNDMSNIQVPNEVNNILKTNSQ